MSEHCQRTYCKLKTCIGHISGQDSAAHHSFLKIPNPIVSPQSKDFQTWNFAFLGGLSQHAFSHKLKAAYLYFHVSFCFVFLDLQNVNITLRILFRPVASELPKIYMSLGEDYDERVLPSITSEVLKAIVVSNVFNFCLGFHPIDHNMWNYILFLTI